MPLAWVIEDNDQNFELLEFLLGERGWQVERASDGAGLRRMLTRVPPAVVLLDMNLPDVAGIDLARELRTHRDFARVPIVAVTAHAMRGDQERFLEAGCDAYVPKPIDTVRLFTILASLTRERAR
jgi:two-component system cell cycle response regulator DivK